MRIALVGIGGYGEVYLRLLDRTPGLWAQLAAVVDPAPHASAFYARLVQEGVPIFDTVEALYAHTPVDLTLIASPIPFHEEQVLAAFRHGSHVLCEKPITPRYAQALALQSAAAAARRKCGVGFQWPTMRAVQALKRDILDGKLGKPVLLKALLPWPRDKAYYAQGGWKGRMRDAQGRWCMDAIATNAGAHYLHILFFLLGETLRTARMPVQVEGTLYRAYPIETFDTCFLRGDFAGGGRFLFLASHACDSEGTPEGEYIFEHATVRVHADTGMIDAQWHDGRCTVYGTTRDADDVGQKLVSMLQAIQEDSEPACDIETALPHLAVCDACFARMPIHTFPAACLQEDAQHVAVRGLGEVMRRCFAQGALPEELGVPWAQAGTRIPMADFLTTLQEG